MESKMKKIVVILALVAIVISLFVSTTIASATDEESALVYKSQLIDVVGVGAPPIIASGEVMVWANGDVKIKLVVEGPVEATYYVWLDEGPPISRDTMLIGPITTDSKGKAVAYYNLSVTGLDEATTPGFAVRMIRPGEPSLPGVAIAVTGFTIPD
jgi:hypothetical protein